MPLRIHTVHSAISQNNTFQNRKFLNKNINHSTNSQCQVHWPNINVPVVPVANVLPHYKKRKHSKNPFQFQVHIKNVTFHHHNFEDIMIVVIYLLEQIINQVHLNQYGKQLQKILIIIIIYQYSWMDVGKKLIHIERSLFQGLMIYQKKEEIKYYLLSLS